MRRDQIRQTAAVLSLLLLLGFAPAWARKRTPSLPFSDDLPGALTAAEASSRPVVLAFTAPLSPTGSSGS